MIINSDVYSEAKEAFGDQKLTELIELAEERRSTYTLLGYAFNKNREPLLVVEHTDYNLVLIELINTQNRTMFVDLTYRDKETLKIEELQTAINGVYHGSILVAYVKKRAKELGINKIVGNMAYQDYQNDKERDRLSRFYSKRGFHVDGQSISLDITSIIKEAYKRHN